MAFQPAHGHNVADLREAARARLPRGLYEFVLRGTEDELALARNRAKFADIQMRPRVLVDVSRRTTKGSFFGQSASMPVAIAATGAAGLLWFDGEIAIARAAAQANIPFTLSTASIVSMERVAQEAGGRLWFQLYMLPERRMSHELVTRAKSAGYEALVVTVDTVATPNREYNYRNGFSLPMKVTRRNVIDVALHPRWFLQVFARSMLRSGIPMLENYPAELKQRLNESGAKKGLPKSDSVTWSDLVDLRRMWDGPLMVKGLQHPDDAWRAADAGVDGVIVSNHGGRNFDCSMAPIEALPAIVDRVGHRVEVFVDGGFERGTDIVKAVALGARGVFIGRAPLWGVSAAGEPGAARVLTLLREEIDRALAFAGCVSPDVLSRALLHLPEGFGRLATASESENLAAATLHQFKLKEERTT